MNNRQKLSLNIWFFVLVSGIIFFIISLYYYGDYHSIKTFFQEFLDERLNIILIIWIFILSIISWFFAYYISNNIYRSIEEYNKKLKDYNHFLAHELKTPIAVINSNLEVLKYGFDEEKITYSQNELKNITKIIDWLLKFSESFNNLEKKEINLENFIKSIVNFEEYNKSVKIINSEFNFSILTDEILFERIIKNLIENALKYSPNRQVNIYIKTNKITFKNELYKTLEKEELEKIFDKFYSSTCNESTWNWLWLPMIKEITKVLWYELQIDSYNNKFVVEINLK